MNIPGRRFFDNDKVYTDWMPRGGDNIILRADRVASNPDSDGTECSVTIRVFTKNSEETGDGWAVQEPGGSTPLSFAVIDNDTTIKELVVTSIATSTPTNPKGLKEMVRLELVCVGEDPENWIEIRLFPPIFFNSATG